eukprot:NODE_178_length_14069_cov_0.746815.p2 type:complete len:465 gc:universal NODE_178_length_14069_cov_0.746815:4755-6149(+)
MSTMNRNQAVKYLQLPLGDFRMMCILLHVSPKLVNHQQLYLVKDIKHLLHHPLLPIIRELKILKRKCIHYYHKDNNIYKDYMEKINTLLLSQMPKLIQQNYPKFYNLWYDLDDILSLLYCMRHIPSNEYVSSKDVAKTEKLLNQFELLLWKMNIGLTKSFVSIKGIYFQFELQDQPITFIVPLRSSQLEDIDVDYKVMATFHLYYQSILEFFLFKMAKLHSFEYPLALESLKVPNAIPKSKIIKSNSADITAEDFDVQNVNFKKSQNSTLFSGLKFVLHREVPKDIIAFAIKSCGGVIIPCDVKELQLLDGIIEVVDKPAEKVSLFCTNARAVVPQYIFDSINHQKLISFEGYRPGDNLPNHVSPFANSNETSITADLVDQQEQILREEELKELMNEDDSKGFIVKEYENLEVSEDAETLEAKKEVNISTMTQKERRQLGHIISAKSKKIEEAKKLAQKRRNKI